MSSSNIVVDGILFDMDGTLIASTPGVLAAWDIFKQDYPHLDIPTILRTSHGVRSIDTLRRELQLKDDPDEERLRAEVTRFEATVVENGLVLLPGVTNLLNQLKSEGNTINQKWTIVTSATEWYTPKALKAVGLDVPYGMVVAEDVTHGKPHPEPYLKGATNLELDPSKTIVFEDAPSGIEAGKAAGMKVIGLCTSHTMEQITRAEPDFIVKDLSFVHAERKDGKIELEIWPYTVLPN